MNIINDLEIKRDINYISQDDSAFPKALKEYGSCPKGLYVIGRLPGEDEKVSAIVGARKCSCYGSYMADKLGYELVQKGVSVISGMAMGIDTYAHQGALRAINRGVAYDNATTYAVLGCGVDICYPRSNRVLYENIISKGGIISEYPPGTPAMAYRFPARNRIISALSESVIVVEARDRSGSLITADFALEQGKDIYAVPGRCDDALSEGCNRLIKQGAGLVTDASDIFTNDYSVKEANIKKNENNKVTLEKHFQVVYSCVCLQPKSIHTIIEETGLEASYVMGILLKLELMDLIYEPTKNQYARRLS